MKDKILLTLLVSSILVSCSSVYKTGQTPDDVYYSPTREVAKKEQKEETKEEEQKTASSDDQYLKMKVRDRYRWSRIDDYDYWTDSRYNSHCNCTCNPPSYNYGYYYGYSPIRYSNWYPYSPFNPVIGYFNPRYIRGTTSGSNIKAYTNNTFNNTNSPRNPKTGTTSEGSFLKRVFTSSGGTADRTERTFSNGSSGTSSSAGGKSGGYNSSGSSSSGGRGGRGN